MLTLLLHAFTSVCLLTDRVSAVTTEIVVGVAGKRVRLPCRSEAASLEGVDVCWGRGEATLFTCDNTVINTAGDEVTYRRSYRYSASSSTLSIFNSRPADSGFYHCRVQLPGLFNDQISTVHLIIITPRFVVSSTTKASKKDGENLNTPRTTTGNDITGDNSAGPMVAKVQSVQQQQIDSLWSFVGNTVRVSFIAFIPALLLTAAYRVWRTKQRTKTNWRLNQSAEEEGAYEEGSRAF